MDPMLLYTSFTKLVMMEARKIPKYWRRVLYDERMNYRWDLNYPRIIFPLRLASSTVLPPMVSQMLNG